MGNTVIAGTKTQYKANNVIDQTTTQAASGSTFNITTLVIPLQNNFAGYFYYWGGNPAATIGAAANLGYTDIILAFASVTPNLVGFESSFSSYTKYVNGVDQS